MLKDQLALLHGLWAGPEGWSYKGSHVDVDGASFHPKAVDSPGRPPTWDGSMRPRIILGGGGTPRSMRLAARWADEFNIIDSDPQVVAERFLALDEICLAQGRQPDTIVHSVMVEAVVGADRTQFDRRLAALLSAHGVSQSASEWVEVRQSRWVAGTPSEARTMVAMYEDLGIERLVLQDFLPWDLDMIGLIADELFG
jgi:alkanesulfonate monooxygenase SsuD/methylene tetrahydromethanopterin reductase-like flavin-dependent oxidoreductase (luciferase family)